MTSFKSKKEELIISNLRCEYQSNPLGLDTPAPRFTWNFETSDDRFTQKYYQIKVATSPGLLENGMADIWSSDMIESSRSFSEYKGKPLTSHTKYYWNVVVWDNKERKRDPSPTASFEMGKMSPTTWSAQWITDNHDQNFEPSPLFRKTFISGNEIKSARAYICGLGYYELFLNGQRVGKNYLDPGYTHFDKRVLYVTHDVTSLVKSGENVVAAVLGNGWYNEQSVAVWDFNKARWRNRPRMICEIRIIYKDGTIQTIGTDQSWKTNTGAYLYNSIYSGDIYDASLEEDGWNNTGFNDRNWQQAKITNAPAPILQAQVMPAIRIVREIKPLSVKSFGDSIYVFNMGENFAGLCRLKVKGEAGTVITVRHGELLKENGRLEQGNINVYYHPVQAKEIFQTDIYTLKGGGKEEVFTPGFSYHGFQYVEIKSSKPIVLSTDNLTGLFMHTDLTPLGSFSCSNLLLNKIWNASIQSYQSNIHSIPTDCPQREKNGWTADAHVSVDLGLLNFDGILFYEKWMNDFVDNQNEKGELSGIVPSAGWAYGEWPGPVWDAALFIIPDALYHYYNDTKAIAKVYKTCKIYLDYLKKKEKDGLLTFGLGDWVYYKAITPNDYTSSCYYYFDYVMMASFARLLGKEATTYEQKSNQIKELINSRYFNPETGDYANGTQTAQALALYLGIVPEGKEQLVARKLQKAVMATNHFLDFGLLGSKTVPAMLTKYGFVEDAYKMVTKETAPSWGHWVKENGYSTLAETWTLSPEFHDASINHVFMGDVSAWMSNALAGINLDPAMPGFSHIIIQPRFVNELDRVKGEYLSVNGLIRSEWKREGNRIALSVTIPANTTATVYADKIYRVKSGEHRFILKDIELNYQK
ncbi:MAG: family 78 glycoside hydrolase catalytic domain [Bacteroidota bacterium]|nr:family 78 glycoside hydrolase catalytic domain [Bacteroidota bacterium]